MINEPRLLPPAPKEGEYRIIKAATQERFSFATAEDAALFMWGKSSEDYESYRRIGSDYLRLKNPSDDISVFQSQLESLGETPRSIN